MNKVTIQDIARVAGVSKSTVSRVLNSSAAVHPDKRDAVLAATKRLGFQPNVVASSLARGRSMTVGVLTQLMGTPFYDAISQGVIAGFSGTGYSPIFVDGQWQQGEEVEAIQALIGRRVDGLVLIGGSVPEDEIARLCQDLPTVIVARRINSSRSCCISMDNVRGGYLATQHLIEKGHRHIAIIRGLKHHQDAIDRYEGYAWALRDANIPLNPDLVLQGDFSAESGESSITKLLSDGHQFSAVVAANDLTAFGVRLALHRHDRQVPQDISIIGFDDQLESAYMTPPLTTIRQPAQEMGSQASQAILKMMAGKSCDSISVEGELILRESVHDQH